MNSPVYNKIGIGYDNTRRADPYIAERIITHLQPVPNGIYLDIGCGTGNYLHYINQKGFSFVGIDPSEIMLDIAKKKCPACTFVKGAAEKIPSNDNSFDGAMAIFTLHHWKDQQQGLNELYRVLKKGSKIVFLSFTAAQMNEYWLVNYFPQMIKRSGELVPGEDSMINMLQLSGFSFVETEKYFVQPELEDHFLYSNKSRPEKYLDPEVRIAISSFAAFSTSTELKHGFKQLEADINSGKIKEIMNSFNDEKGDYLFYSALK